jgi:hypothetical protein
MALGSLLAAGLLVFLRFERERPAAEPAARRGGATQTPATSRAR